MEFASFLAGERWSDHPQCTHRLLAALARDVNDHVGDVRRTDLVPMIPDVVGLTSEDPHWDVYLARDVALTALPIAAEERQRVAALGILRCELELGRLDGHSSDQLSEASRRALEETPGAADWARRFVVPSGRRSFAACSAPAIVHTGVTAIADAVVDDPEAILVDMLRRNIAWCLAQRSVVAVRGSSRATA